MASGKDCAIKVCKSTLGSVGVEGSPRSERARICIRRPSALVQVPVVSKQVFPYAEGQNNLLLPAGERPSGGKNSF